MELVLLEMLALFRPILFIETGVKVLGLNSFEAAAILFSAVIFSAVAMRAATHRNINLSITDVLIAAFVFWCVAIYVIYMDKAHISALAKFVIPLLTYVVAKSVIPGRATYLKMLWLLIVGFAVPLLGSVFLILHGGGLEEVNYWTGTLRYEGAYSSAHDMSHNAGFMLMAIWLYLIVRKENATLVREFSLARKCFLAVLVLAAVFLIYKSSVRTTVLGLAIFVMVLLAMHYRKPLLIGAVAIILVSSFALSENVQKRFFPEGEWAEKSADFDATDYGSARPNIWKRQLVVFVGLPIDKQLAGIGIGNTLADEIGRDSDYVLKKDTHNDFFRVMVHTGVVGLLLFVGLQVAIFRKILTLDRSVKYGFAAIFVAVTAMNFISNSYISRFGLAQMLYLILAYAELRPDWEKEGAKG